MSNISFERKTETVETPAEGVTVDCETTVASADAAAPEQAPAAAPAQGFPTRPANESRALAATSAESPHAIFDDNNIGFEDIILPRINIVQKVGDLSNVFTPGEIVLDQSQVLYSPAKTGAPAAKPLNIVVIGFKRTSFVEKVQGGAMGLVCRTREEVHAKGGTLDYKEWEDSVRASKENPALKPLRRFDYMTTALVLVEKPEGFEDPHNTAFPYECDGKQYVMAFFTMKSSAYNSGAKTIFTHKKTRSIANPRASYSDNFFTLGTELKKYPGNVFAFIPDIKGSAPTTPAIIELVNNIKGVQ